MPHQIKEEYVEALAKEFPDLHCPLSLELFSDPVLTSEGETYERKEIEAWFAKGKKTDPLRQDIELKSLTLIPNLAIKKSVVKLLADRPYLLKGNPNKEEILIAKPVENKAVSQQELNILVPSLKEVLPVAKPALSLLPERAVPVLPVSKDVETLDHFLDYQMVDFTRDKEKAKAALADPRTCLRFSSNQLFLILKSFGSRDSSTFLKTPAGQDLLLLIFSNPIIMAKIVKLDKASLLELASIYFSFAKLLAEETLKPINIFAISLFDLKKVILEQHFYAFIQHSDIFLQIAIQLLEANQQAPNTLTEQEVTTLISTPIVAQFIITNTKRAELLARYNEVALNRIFKNVKFADLEPAFVNELMRDINLIKRLSNDSLILVVSASQNSFNFAVDNCLHQLPDDVKSLLLKKADYYNRQTIIISATQKEKIIASIDFVNLTDKTTVTIYLENCTDVKIKELFSSQNLAVQGKLHSLQVDVMLDFAKKAGALEGQIRWLQVHCTQPFYETTEKVSSFLKKNSRSLNDAEVSALVGFVLRDKKPILISDLVINDERCAKALLAIPDWHREINPNWGNAGNIIGVLYKKFESVKAIVEADETLKALLNSSVRPSAPASPVIKAPAKPAPKQPQEPDPENSSGCLVM